MRLIYFCSNTTFSFAKLCIAITISFCFHCFTNYTLRLLKMKYMIKIANQNNNTEHRTNIKQHPILYQRPLIWNSFTFNITSSKNKKSTNSKTVSSEATTKGLQITYSPKTALSFPLVNKPQNFTPATTDINHFTSVLVCPASNGLSEWVVQKFIAKPKQKKLENHTCSLRQQNHPWWHHLTPVLLVTGWAYAQNPLSSRFLVSELQIQVKQEAVKRLIIKSNLL